MSRKQIWLNPPLERLAEKCTGKGRDGTFSRRLGNTVERYETIIKLTAVPELTDEEKLIIGEVFCGSVINPTTIRHMPESIMDCATGTKEEKLKLKTLIEKLSPAERIAIIEAMGL